jgi:hypothetical protein
VIARTIKRITVKKFVANYESAFGNTRRSAKKTAKTTKKKVAKRGTKKRTTRRQAG